MGYSQKDLADVSRVPLHIIQKLERLEMPYENFNMARDVLNRVSQALEVTLDSLFPQDYLDMLQAKLLPKRRMPIIWYQEIRLSELPPSMDLLSLPAPEEMFIEAERIIAIPVITNKLLDTLPPRERQVIEIRYGLKGEKPKTLEETGLMFNVTRERIRQVEMIAMARLRNTKLSSSVMDIL